MKKFCFFLLWAVSIGLHAQSNITRIEYFIDTDPGRGNGTSINLSSPTISILENVNISSLSLGFHVFTVRAEDANGVWGIIESKPFFISLSTTASQNDIVSMEYFIDADPGRGSGVDIPITPSLSLDILEYVPTSLLSEGFHIITVRAQDERGIWGLSESKPFYVNQSTGAIQNNIVALEYFIDTDPGLGSGVDMPITPSLSLDISENVPTSTLTEGFHVFTVRAQDERGVWGLSESKPFVVLPTQATNLVALEYFIDADPSIGSGTSIPITPVQSINISDNISISSLTDGFHTFSIRAQDDRGVWGEVESKPFFVSQSSTIIQNNITAMEYYVDIDPGQGNGFPLTVSPGATINILENIQTGTLANGIHVIFIRAQDNQGVWGLSTSKVFFVDEGRLIINYEYVIDTDPGVGLATQQIINPPAANIDETILIDTNPLSTGDHNLIVRVQDSNKFWSKTSTARFTVCESANAAFSAGPACLGTSTTFTDLSTNVQSGDIYSWDFDGDLVEDDNTTGSTSFTYPAAGTYTATLTISRSGCTSIATISVQVGIQPNAPSGSDVTICEGQTALLTVSGGADGQYRWYSAATGSTLATTSTSDNFTTPPLTSSTSYFVAINNGICESTRTQLNVTVTGVCNSPPVIATLVITVTIQGIEIIDLLPLLSDPDDNLDLSSLRVITQPSSGAIASISGTDLFLNYTGINFTGTDFLTLEICDLFLACTQQQLQIEVVGDIIVYNAISPNGDGLNDSWTIQHINTLEPDNRVRIYNRWGDKVFDMLNYDNVDRRFSGIGTGGKKLPSGVYFYKIEFVSGREALTGFLSIKN